MDKIGWVTDKSGENWTGNVLQRTEGELAAGIARIQTLEAELRQEQTRARDRAREHG